MAEGSIIVGKYELFTSVREASPASPWQSWRGVAPGENTEVEVTVINPSSVEGPHAVARFLHEARLARGVSSPHAVQVLDDGIDGATGAPFLVTEWVPGETLDQRLEGTRLRARDVSEIVRQVADALRATHALGTLHRDLKPSSIVLIDGEDGIIAKLRELALAKWHLDGIGELGRSRARKALVASPYMSPEQLLDPGKVDQHADLWSLAVVAFEALTGRQPFIADSAGDLAYQIRRGVRPVPSKVGIVPAGFDEWFARATARDIRQRFRSAEELGATLHALCYKPEPLPTYARWSSSAVSRIGSTRPPAAAAPAEAPPAPEPVVAPANAADAPIDWAQEAADEAAEAAAWSAAAEASAPPQVAEAYVPSASELQGALSHAALSPEEVSDALAPLGAAPPIEAALPAADAAPAAFETYAAPSALDPDAMAAALRSVDALTTPSPPELALDDDLKATVPITRPAPALAVLPVVSPLPPDAPQMTITAPMELISEKAHAPVIHDVTEPIPLSERGAAAEPGPAAPTEPSWPEPPRSPIATRYPTVPFPLAFRSGAVAAPASGATLSLSEASAALFPDSAPLPETAALSIPQGAVDGRALRDGAASALSIPGAGRPRPPPLVQVPVVMRPQPPPADATFGERSAFGNPGHALATAGRGPRPTLPPFAAVPAASFGLPASPPSLRAVFAQRDMLWSVGFGILLGVGIVTVAVFWSRHRLSRAATPRDTPAYVVPERGASDAPAR